MKKKTCPFCGGKVEVVKGQVRCISKCATIMTLRQSCLSNPSLAKLLTKVKL